MARLAHDPFKRFVVKPIAAILLVGLFFFAFQALFVKVYLDVPSRPFSGSNIYNPYSNLSGGEWLKMNLHAHTSSWGGITNGVNTAEEVIGAYHSLDYDVIGISNYQSIQRVSEVPEGVIYMPTYEHGYGINKYHQLMIDPNRVSWFEQLYYFNTAQMQQTFISLRNDAELICFNHPQFTRWLNPDVMKSLKGYDLIEAASGMASSSTNYWDVALSAGIPSFVLANDDSHSVTPIENIGHFYTMVYAKKHSKEGVIEALRKGAHYAVHAPNHREHNPENLPRLSLLKLVNDTISVQFSQTPTKIVFIGQEAAVRGEVMSNSFAQLPVTSEDTYIRIEAEFADGTRILTNPLFRYDLFENTNEPLRTFHKLPVIVDELGTMYYRIICVLVLILLYFSSRRLWKW